VLPSLKRKITEVCTEPSPLSTESWGNLVKVTALGTGIVNADESAPSVRVENDATGEDSTNVVATITDDSSTLEFDLPNRARRRNLRPQRRHDGRQQDHEGRRADRDDAEGHVAS
jgi:hypothetical protein